MFSTANDVDENNKTQTWPCYRKQNNVCAMFVAFSFCVLDFSLLSPPNSVYFSFLCLKSATHNKNKMLVVPSLYLSFCHSCFVYSVNCIFHVELFFLLIDWLIDWFAFELFELTDGLLDDLLDWSLCLFHFLYISLNSASFFKLSCLEVADSFSSLCIHFCWFFFYFFQLLNSSLLCVGIPCLMIITTTISFCHAWSSQNQSEL